MRVIQVILILFFPILVAADTVTYICTYPIYATVDGLDLAENFTLTFIIDEENDKSYMVGNNGSSEVTSIPGEGQVTFIEVTATANVMTTTILTTGASVHSRNSVILGDLLASQYYGTCEFR